MHNNKKKSKIMHSNNNTNNNNKNPFDVVVLTSANIRQAESFKYQLQKQKHMS